MIGLESRPLPTMPPQYYLLAALAFSLLVIIHELGHFLVARAFGMRARVFSIGFGPPLVQWRPKGSETIVQVAAVPILAYVNIAGMNPLEPSDPNDRGSYQNASLVARFFTIAGGPLANYLAATLIIFAVLAFAGVERPVVGQVQPDSAAAVAGMRPGDVVLRIGDNAPSSFGELAGTINASRGAPTEIRVRREGREVSLRAAARLDPASHRYRIGIVQSPTPATDRVPVGSAVRHALLEPARLTIEQLDGFARMIRGKEKVQVMGPVGIVVETARGAHRGGWRYAADAMALISVALFVLNLLPGPALDGGRLVFLMYEVVMRRRPNARFETTVTAIFFTLLLGLGAIVIVRDVANLAMRS
jgi:regulator of sigma E protease